VAAGDVVPAGRYPVWADGTGVWQTSGPEHWAAGFATSARRLAEVCGLAAIRGSAPEPVVPDDVEVSSFHAFTGWYAGDDGQAPRIARRLAAALLPGGALAVTEADLRGQGGPAVAYCDAVGPAAALLGRHVDPEAGARHARWTLETLQRPDGSILQAARVDPTTGAVTDVYTAAQGFGRASRWSRAQAWGLLGAAMAPPGSVTTAGRRPADWWLANAPQGAAPPWDFDAPAGGPMDTSAGAIAATAFLRLAGAEDGPRVAAYRRAGLQLVAGLLAHVDDGGALLDGCYHRPAGLAPANELVWGDYYLAEALALATGALSPSSAPTPGHRRGPPA
jgi:unsaturated chondroitin disaccharide hydrolase